MNFRIAVLFVALFASPAVAQWQTPNHSVPLGRGAGATGFSSAVPGAAGQALVSNGPSADPSFQAAGGFFKTVKDYGAVGDGVTNDTAAIQSMIDASCPGHLTTLSIQTFPIIIPPAIYAITQLNATNCGGFTMIGQGIPAGVAGGAILKKIVGANVNAVLDLTGSTSGFNLRNFYIQASTGDTDTPYPNFGILLASSALNPNNGNFNFLESVSISGRFGIAALYSYGVCCSSFNSLGLTQAHPSNANTYAWAHVDTNFFSAISSFTTIATGAQGASNVACYRCEAHSFTGSSTTSGRALLLEGPRGFGYRDGIIASNSSGGMVLLANAATQVTFESTQFYTDLGAGAPYAIQQASGSIKNLLLVNNDVTLLAGGALTNLAGTFSSGRVTGGIINIGGITIDNYHSGDIGTPPAISGCGTSPGAAAGTDSGGTVTEGTNAVGCVITFATPYPTVPACTVVINTGITLASGATTTTLTVAHANSSGLKLSWNCSGP